ncbi:hypothetical protein FACS189415_5220 [Bacteroidia bacterium]|nr:hypothetical protein FACS189415_5220 [Bacteroidia bacterium]GHV07172.1 hypothetical protein FACS189416_7810 [Bacteroidia bacterium]
MKKQFLSTKLFLLLQEASQEGIDVDAQVLQNGYDEFALLVFSEDAASTGRAAFRNTLAYTRVELKSLSEVSGKKCGNFSFQSNSTR